MPVDGFTVPTTMQSATMQSAMVGPPVEPAEVITPQTLFGGAPCAMVAHTMLPSLPAGFSIPPTAQNMKSSDGFTPPVASMPGSFNMPTTTQTILASDGLTVPATMQSATMQSVPFGPPAESAEVMA